MFIVLYTVLNKTSGMNQRVFLLTVYLAYLLLFQLILIPGAEFMFLSRVRGWIKFYSFFTTNYF